MPVKTTETKYCHPSFRHRNCIHISQCLSVLLSSNTTCSICFGFAVQLVVQQIHDKSTTFRQIHNISTRQDVVDLLWTQQQIHNKSNQWSIAFDLSTTSRKAVQQIHNFTTSPTTCTTNPQQIEQEEFELYYSWNYYGRYASWYY
jgi:hypothetical protein